MSAPQHTESEYVDSASTDIQPTDPESTEPESVDVGSTGTPEAVEIVSNVFTGLPAELIEDCNHYTILLGTAARTVVERFVALGG